MSVNISSYCSPKVEMRESVISGNGLFAKENIGKGEIVVNFDGGKGKIVDLKTADEFYESGNDNQIQVGDDEFFYATTDDEIENADFFNHSCDPNCGIKGILQIVAMRDILSGEEITFDYAMSESSDYKINCKCGSPNCRKIITGNDWKIPELQKRYKGYFSDYLQKQIT